MDSRWARCPVMIPYYGGKYEISKKLVPMLHDHERYLEVFGGGLSMFFRKKKAKASVVNDLDSDIINLYMSVLDKFDEFSELVFWIPRARSLFNTFKQEIKSSKEIEIPDPKRAAMYYYVIRCSFNKNPYNSFSMSPKKEWREDLIKELRYSRERFNATIIENLDFREFFDRYKPKEDDMWYLDPPYIIAGEKGSYYLHDFDQEDHNDLVSKCEDIHAAGGKFMVSYDNRDIIREIYSDVFDSNEIYMNTIKTIYASSTDKKIVEELVITNYVAVQQSELFG